MMTDFPGETVRVDLKTSAACRFSLAPRRMSGPRPSLSKTRKYGTRPSALAANDQTRRQIYFLD